MKIQKLAMETARDWFYVMAKAILPASLRNFEKPMTAAAVVAPKVAKFRKQFVDRLKKGAAAAS